MLPNLISWLEFKLALKSLFLGQVWVWSEHYVIVCVLTLVFFVVWLL
jgi:hypothetical protein